MEFYVAGVKHHKLFSVINEIEEGKKLNLVLEPTNTFDPYAVRIEYEGTMLGYVPKKHSEEVYQWIKDAHQKVGCTVIELNKEIDPWRMLKVSIGD